MPANCHECGTLVEEPESRQSLPSVVNPDGEPGLTAHVSVYKCGCGHKFTTIEYEHGTPPPLSSSQP